MNTLFFDDNPSNIVQFAPFANVKAVLVEPAETVPFEVYASSQANEGNAYATSVMNTRREEFDGFEFGSGLEVAVLRREVERLSKIKMIILDWDLTFSVCNGLYLPPNVELPSAAVFYAGGEDRFEELKRIFAEVRQRSASIIVLTDNGNAEEGQRNKATRDRFVKLIQQFDPLFRPDELFFGNGAKGDIYETKIMQKKPLLTGGRRKHKTKNSQTVMSETPRTIRRFQREENTRLQSEIAKLVRENKQLKKQLQEAQEAQLAPLRELERRLQEADAGAGSSSKNAKK